jgi:hypothetical protein
MFNKATSDAALRLILTSNFEGRFQIGLVQLIKTDNDYVLKNAPA